MKIFLCVFLLIGAASASLLTTKKSPSAIADLVLLSHDPTAVCLDGSSAGYYFRPAGSKKGEGKFMIELEGGGECVTSDDCHSRAKTDLGSSKNWNATMELSQIEDEHCSFNADFCEWNQVFVKYCSGDLWTGQATQPSPKTFGLSFNGHFNLLATINHLLATQNLADASIVVLTGDSAGGIGTFVNVDFVKQQLPPTVRYFAVPVAGFYFPTSPYTGPGADVHGVPFLPSTLESYVDLWDSFLPANCKAVFPKEEWKCLLANNSYTSLNTSVYIIEAQTDRVQLELHDYIPPSSKVPTSPPEMVEYIKAWGGWMNEALAIAMDSRPDFGLFSPACYIHTEFRFSAPLIQGQSFYDGLVDWAFGGMKNRVLRDDCHGGIVCNPKC